MAAWEVKLADAARRVVAEAAREAEALSDADPPYSPACTRTAPAESPAESLRAADPVRIAEPTATMAAEATREAAEARCREARADPTRRGSRQGRGGLRWAVALALIDEDVARAAISFRRAVALIDEDAARLAEPEWVILPAIAVPSAANPADAERVAEAACSNRALLVIATEAAALAVARSRNLPLADKEAEAAKVAVAFRRSLPLALTEAVAERDAVAARGTAGVIRVALAERAALAARVEVAARVVGPPPPMKPKPFWALNRFTLPVAMRRSPTN